MRREKVPPTLAPERHARPARPASPEAATPRREGRIAPPAADVHAGLEPSGSLDAGEFSAWLTAMGAALQGKRASAVPCGDCTACCTSSQFVHIGPDETDTLAQIPAKLLFPAPGLPRGHVLLGYDDRGHCPMLVDGRCSIYEHRPRTCRTYDCRVFPAAAVSADDDKIFIVRQSRRWAFRFPTDADRLEHEAVRAAAKFLVERREELPARVRPANATQLAVLALEVHRVFFAQGELSGRAVPTLDAVIAAVTRSGEKRVSEAPREETRRQASRGSETRRVTARRAGKQRAK